MVWPFHSKNHFDVDNKLCVISGGSQGLGFEIAKRLVSKNANVVIVSRTESKLAAKLKELEESRLRDDQLITYIAADLSTYDGCLSVFENLEPDIVFCCAGSAMPNLFTNLTGEDLEQGIKQNLNTALFFSHVAFNKMSKDLSRGKKHIVFFSSVVSFFSFIGYGQYSPSKAAIRSLADTLRQEGLPYNIDVSCVFPGNFASEGYAEEKRTKPEITKIIEGASEAISCAECCDIVLKQLEGGSKFVTTDFIGYFLSCMMLGNSPRVYWPVQVLFSFILSLVIPIANLYMNLQIISYFQKGGNDRTDKQD